MDFQITRRVHRSPGDVFAMLADVQRWATRGTVVPVMEKIPSGATRVGTRWRELVRVLPGATMTMWTEVSSLVPDRLLGLRFENRWMAGHIEYRLTPVDGDTEFTWTETIHPRGILRLADPLMDRLLRPRLVDRMTAICRLLDSGERTRLAGPPSGAIRLPGSAEAW